MPDDDLDVPGDVAGIRDPHDGTRQRGQPLLVQAAAALGHVELLVVAGRPREERLGLRVERLARRRGRAVALPLALAQPRHPDLRRQPHEHHQVEARDEHVAPAAQRARQHPRRLGRERLTEKIEVTVAVDWNIDIRERSYAVFEKPFIAGAPFIQIVGRLDVDQVKPKKKLGQTPYPEIREGASFLQATSTSAQELLTKAGVTVDRLNELLSPDNIGAVSDTLRNLATTTTGLAKQDASIQATLADLPGAVAEFRKTFDKLNGVADTLNLIAMEVGPQDEATRKALAGKDPGELSRALVDARKAFANIDGAANQLSKLVADNRAPIRQFTEAGLTELSLTIRELRQLTANLNVIATRLERDPAGFVFSGKQGYTPK